MPKKREDRQGEKDGGEREGSRSLAHRCRRARVSSLCVVYPARRENSQVWESVVLQRLVPD